MANEDNLSIVVVGASGNLAKTKIYPALFSLYCQGFLSANTNIFGFARSKFSTPDFRQAIEENLTCRYTPQQDCAEKQKQFLHKCHYVAGQYDSRDSFLKLYEEMRQTEASPAATNRIYYLAIPPSVFLNTIEALGDTGLIQRDNQNPWSRVVIEKPFGKDRASADELTAGISQVIDERDIYRIDHYLGKEAIQNLMALRFANLIFEPVWNRKYIDRVCIDWKETIGVEDRAGYFEDYGIVRDVIQNHLLQILSLIAMEEPQSLHPHDVRDEKVKVLKQIPPPSLDNICLGQYTADERGHPGYLEEHGVPADSNTPTYAAVVLRVANERWQDVPFIVTAGKGLNADSTEVRIHFKDMENNIFKEKTPALRHNQFTIRVQPDEALFLNFNAKRPGLSSSIVDSNLNFVYGSTFKEVLPDAYERLLLDVIRGDKTLFIRSDELAAAWDVFTPVLHSINDQHIKPKKYMFGSDRPHILQDIL